MRIAGFCWPPIVTCATPEIWLICCASWASTASLTSVSGSVSEVADSSRIGEVGRVDLAVGRRRGQVLRQLAAGGVDRGLHVVGGAVDVAVEVELDRDRRRSEITRRRHLRDAGNLRELALERLRHRGGHGFRAGAWQAGGDLDGRKIHLRQRRHGQQRIGDQADEQNARHHQRGADGIADEGCGNALAHSGLTLVWAASELATAVLTRTPGCTRYCPAVITCCPGDRPSSITERPSIDWPTLTLRSSALLS